MKIKRFTLQHQFVAYMLTTTAAILGISFMMTLWLQNDILGFSTPSETALLVNLESAATTTAVIAASPTTDATNWQTVPPDTVPMTAVTITAIATEGIEGIKLDLAYTLSRNYFFVILGVILAQLIGSILWVNKTLVTPLHQSISKIDALASDSHRLEACVDGPHELAHLNHQLYVLSEELWKNKAHKEAEAAKRKALIAGISHDLRTPLTNISGYSETLLMEDEMTPTHRDWLEIILRNAQLANGLISSLLELNRYDLTQHPIKTTEVSLTALLHRCKEDFQNSLTQVDQHLLLELDHLPKTIYSDEILLLRLFKNIISNFNQHAGSGATLTLSGAVLRNELHLRFQDNGVGIASDEVEKLTDLFYIGDQSRSKLGSSGLGLYNCQQIVSLLGGQLDIESAVGEGLIVHITLPMA